MLGVGCWLLGVEMNQPEVTTHAKWRKANRLERRGYPVLGLFQVAEGELARTAHRSVVDVHETGLADLKLDSWMPHAAFLSRGRALPLHSRKWAAQAISGEKCIFLRVEP